MQRGSASARVALALLTTLLLALGLAACGGGEDVTVTQEATSESTDGESTDDVAELEEQIEELQDEVDSGDDSESGLTTTSTTTPDEAPPEGDTGGVPADAANCGAGVYVDSSTTSCAFGKNVAADYFSSPGNTFESFSPTTGESYEMTCAGPPPIVCTGGDGAVVYLTHA